MVIAKHVYVEFVFHLPCPCWFGSMFGSSSCWKLSLRPSLNLLAEVARFYPEVSWTLWWPKSSQESLNHQSQNSPKASVIRLHVLLLVSKCSPLFSPNMLMMLISQHGVDFALIWPQDTISIVLMMLFWFWERCS